MLYRRVIEMLKGFTLEFQVFTVDLAMSVLVAKPCDGTKFFEGFSLELFQSEATYFTRVVWLA